MSLCDEVVCWVLCAWHRFMLRTDGSAPRNICFFCLCIWNYTRITNDWNIKHCGAAGRSRSKLCETPIYRYIYDLYLLILAINITVKFTIHLEHTRKASFFTPALMVWSRLNISFQKICINPHRPYTVHKLWKGLFFFQLHFLCNSQNTARLPATKYNIQLSQIFFYSPVPHIGKTNMITV